MRKFLLIASAVALFVIATPAMAHDWRGNGGGGGFHPMYHPAPRGAYRGGGWHGGGVGAGIVGGIIGGVLLDQALQPPMCTYNNFDQLGNFLGQSLAPCPP